MRFALLASLWAFSVIAQLINQEYPTFDGMSHSSYCFLKIKVGDAELEARLKEHIHGHTFTADLFRNFKTVNNKSKKYIQYTRVHVDNILLYSHETILQNDAPAMHAIIWGDYVHNVNHASFEIFNGSIVGMLDGRKIGPLPLHHNPSNATFRDGKAIPAPKLAKGLKYESISLFQTALSKLLDSCTMEFYEQEPVESLDLPRQDYGHGSNTYNVESCIDCKALAIGDAAASQVVTCIFGTIIGCIVGAVVNSVNAVDAMNSCQNGPDCCPVRCEPTGVSSPGCCFSDETCLNGNGLCCNAGTASCAGIACCPIGQNCITTGAFRGFCCPHIPCGDACCDDGQICQDEASSLCCHSHNICGGSCCDIPGGFSLEGSDCVSGLLGLCCPNGNINCNGACCTFDGCCGGHTCCASEHVCQNGQCVQAVPGSPELCQDKYGITWSGKFCSVDTDCPVGAQHCMDDCCINDVAK